MSDNTPQGSSYIDHVLDGSIRIRQAVPALTSGIENNCPVEFRGNLFNQAAPGALIALISPKAESPAPATPPTSSSSKR